MSKFKYDCTCICPTYGRGPERIHLLNDAVASFAWQELDGLTAELLILNDASTQELVTKVPNVRIINSEYRWPTLGDKYNAMLNLASGGIILPWEDDDISLPHRIRQSVERLATYQYWNPQRSYFEDGRGVHTSHRHGVCHNCSAYKNGVLKYPSSNGNQDHIADTYAKLMLDCSPDALSDDPDEWNYIYRWGVSDYHLSGFRDMNAAYARPEAMPGLFELKPIFSKDYSNVRETRLAKAPD